MKKCKKITSLLLSFVLILSVFGINGIQAFAESGFKFDIDGDGYTTAADAIPAYRAVMGLEELSDGDIEILDANSDGRIIISDVRSILRHSAFMETYENAAPARQKIGTDRSKSKTELIIKSEYNGETNELTVTVSGKNIAGTIAGNLFLDYEPEQLEHIITSSNNDVMEMCVDGALTIDGIAPAAFIMKDGIPNEAELFSVTFKLLYTEPVDYIIPSDIICYVGSWFGTDAPDDVSASSAMCDHSSVEIRNAVEATYQTPGYTGDKYCAVCGKLLEEGRATSVLGESENDFSYIVENGGAVITKFFNNGSSMLAIIPQTLGGYPVTGISEFAFTNSNISGVAIPATVSSIGYPAFGDYYEDTGDLVVYYEYKIYGKTGTAAEAYAKENGIDFIADNYGAENGYELRPGTPVSVYGGKRYLILDNSVNIDILIDKIGRKDFEVWNADGFMVSMTGSIGSGCKMYIRDNNGAYTSEYIIAVRYDTNGDDTVTAADARMALRAAASLETLEGASFVSADTDGNGKITAADARKILRVSAKLD